MWLQLLQFRLQKVNGAVLVSTHFNYKHRLITNSINTKTQKQKKQNRTPAEQQDCIFSLARFYIPAPPVTRQPTIHTNLNCSKTGVDGASVGNSAFDIWLWSHSTITKANTNIMYDNNPNYWGPFREDRRIIDDCFCF